jgi:hypothetical protein
MERRWLERWLLMEVVDVGALSEENGGWFFKPYRGEKYDMPIQRRQWRNATVIIILF